MSNDNSAAPSNAAAPQQSTPEQAPAQAPDQSAPAQNDGGTQTQTVDRFATMRRMLDRDRTSRVSQTQQSDTGEQKSFEERFVADPLAALQEVGLTPEDINRLVQEGGRQDPLAPVESRLEQLERELQESKQTQQAREWEAAVKETHSEVSSFISENKDTYPYVDAISDRGGSELVMQALLTKLEAGEDTSFEAEASYVNQQLSEMAEAFRPLLEPSRRAPAPASISNDEFTGGGSVVVADNVESDDAAIDRIARKYGDTLFRGRDGQGSGDPRRRR